MSTKIPLDDDLAQLLADMRSYKRPPQPADFVRPMYAENAFSHWEIKDGECWRCAPVPEVRRLLRTKFGRGSGH